MMNNLTTMFEIMPTLGLAFGGVFITIMFIWLTIAVLTNVLKD